MTGKWQTPQNNKGLGKYAKVVKSVTDRNFEVLLLVISNCMATYFGLERLFERVPSTPKLSIDASLVKIVKAAELMTCRLNLKCLILPLLS